MSLCFKNSKMNENIAKDLLVKIDWFRGAYFFQESGLWELGWCLKFLLDWRSVKYHKEQQVFKKTEIVEFYWFNSSPNRFNKRVLLQQLIYVIACIVIFL